MKPQNRDDFLDFNQMFATPGQAAARNPGTVEDRGSIVRTAPAAARSEWLESLARPVVRAQPFARAGDGPASLGQNSAMRDLAHGVIGALIAYAVYKLAGHAVWSLAALVLYVPVYLLLRDRFPLRERGRAADRT